jgi:hypothetical protein
VQKALAVDIEKQRKAEEARRKACAQVLDLPALLAICLLYLHQRSNTDAAPGEHCGEQARKDFAMSTADYQKNLADRLAKIKDGQGLLMQVRDLDLPALLVQTLLTQDFLMQRSIAKRLKAQAADLFRNHLKAQGLGALADDLEIATH